jgi:hypothetical protein
MERQRKEDEIKYRSSKKGQEAEQSILNRVCKLCKPICLGIIESQLVHCHFIIQGKNIYFIIINGVHIVSWYSFF